MRKVCFCTGLIALACGAGLLVGCKEEPVQQPLPFTNLNYFDGDGRPVGHLKPEPFIGPPLGTDGQPLPAADPVVWVVEDGQVSQPEYEFDVNIFRLDFDEKEPITDDILPYALMTRDTRQVVIHRGPPPANFSHPDINEGEPCLPVWRCGKRDCPRVVEIDNFALFPAPADANEPACPFCDSSDFTAPWQVPQHGNMVRHRQGAP